MTMHTAPAAALAVGLLFSPLLVATPARAAHAKTPWWVPQLRAGDLAPVGAQATATSEQAAKTAAPSPSPTPVQAASAAPAAAPAAAAAAILPDATLQKYNGLLRAGVIGRDANARAYIDLIAAGKATPAQVNDFAAYIAKKGMPRLALAYQEYAIRLDGNDAVLWLNLGTMQQTVGKLSDAQDSYKKSLALDPNDGLTHYNLGVVYDAKKDYDKAIDEYRKALVLDPALGDPKKNPQVVNNEHMLAVKLEIYQDQAGALGLPLKQMQTGTKTSKDAASGTESEKH